MFCPWILKKGPLTIVFSFTVHSIQYSDPRSINLMATSYFMWWYDTTWQLNFACHVVSVLKMPPSILDKLIFQTVNILNNSKLSFIVTDHSYLSKFRYYRFVIGWDKCILFASLWKISWVTSLKSHKNIEAHVLRDSNESVQRKNYQIIRTLSDG